MLKNKTCCRCKETKPLSEFFNDKSKRDGKGYACKACLLAAQKQYRALHPPKQNWRLYYYREKRLVLTHYGDGKCACVKCGFDDVRALSIDHIAGQGNRIRRELNFGGQMYHWLKMQGYPKGYQTLCMNCQFVKRIENKECSIK